ATGAVLFTVDGTNDENLFRAHGIGDVDGDQVPDVAVVARVGGDVRAYSGRTGALLWSLQRSGFEDFSGPLAPLGDVDGDGVPDLAAAATDFLYPPYAGVYSGRDGTEIRRHTPAASSLDLATIPDLDGDGVR